MQYFFILGREPELSFAEIKAVLETRSIKYDEIHRDPTFVILNFDQTADETAPLMATLAGTVKLGEIVKEINHVKAEEMIHMIPERESKTLFGISTYGFTLPLLHFGKGLKYLLKQQGRSCRFVTSKENPLSSVVVAKNKLIEKGVEINIFKIPGKFLLGRTLAVQDFEKYSHFDFDRPASDPRSGMLPPKLSQMMINLTKDQKKNCLLDPCCGSGTVLQQAIILGYKKVIGSDLSPKAVKDSETNLMWLGHELNKKINHELYVSDIRNLSVKIKRGSISAIVSEPDLGPPLRGGEPQRVIQQIINDLQDFYKTVLEQISLVLDTDQVAVIVVPEIKTSHGNYKFSVSQILPKSLKIGGQWQYARENQRVIRNIYKFVKIDG